MISQTQCAPQLHPTELLAGSAAFSGCNSQHSQAEHCIWLAPAPAADVSNCRLCLLNSFLRLQRQAQLGRPPPVTSPCFCCRYGQWPGSNTKGYAGPVTNCTITTGSMQNIANGLVETFDNTAETFRSECSALPPDGFLCWSSLCLHSSPLFFDCSGVPLLSGRSALSLVTLAAVPCLLLQTVSCSTACPAQSLLPLSAFFYRAAENGRS